MNKSIIVRMIVLFLFVQLSVPPVMHAQRAVQEKKVDLEDEYADDVDFFDDKIDDLFDDFDRIVAEDLDALFEQIVVDEDYQDKQMVPRLMDEEIREAELTDDLEESDNEPIPNQ